MKNNLKFRIRAGIYSNSTKTCTYDPIGHRGFSYGWWQVSGIFDGVPVFNSASYSVTTSAHQSAIGLRFFRVHPGAVVVDFHPGLQKARRGNELADVRDFLTGELKGLAAKQVKSRVPSSTAYRHRQSRIDQINRDLERIDKVLAIKAKDSALAPIAGALISQDAWL